MEELVELQLYIGMNSVPKSWTICYQNAFDTFRDDWLLDFDFKEICEFYELPTEFVR